MMAVVGVANAILFLVVQSVLLHRSRRGHMIEIALITTIAGVAAFPAGQCYAACVAFGLISISDPFAWDLEQPLSLDLGLVLKLFSRMAFICTEWPKAARRVQNVVLKNANIRRSIRRPIELP